MVDPHQPDDTSAAADAELVAIIPGQLSTDPVKARSDAGNRETGRLAIDF